VRGTIYLFLKGWEQVKKVGSVKSPFNGRVLKRKEARQRKEDLGKKDALEKSNTEHGLSSRWGKETVLKASRVWKGRARWNTSHRHPGLKRLSPGGRGDRRNYPEGKIKHQLERRNGNRIERSCRSPVCGGRGFSKGRDEKIYRLKNEGKGIGKMVRRDITDGAQCYGQILKNLSKQWSDGKSCSLFDGNLLELQQKDRI